MCLPFPRSLGRAFQGTPGNIPHNWFFHYSSTTELKEDVIRREKQSKGWEGRNGAGILDMEYKGKGNSERSRLFPHQSHGREG